MSFSQQTTRGGVHRRAFTLIEMLLVIGIIAILAAIVILAVNPQKQLRSSRDADRNSGAKQLMNALSQLSIEKVLLNNAKILTGVGTAKPVCKGATAMLHA